MTQLPILLKKKQSEYLGQVSNLRYGIYLQFYLEEMSYGQIHPSSGARGGIQREQDRGR